MAEEPSTWTASHDEFVALMSHRPQAAKTYLKQQAKKLRDVNADHFLADGAHFNLLFHAITNKNFEAFTVLIELGTAPAWVNENGNSIVPLLVKRNLVTWLQKAVENLTKKQIDELLNAVTVSGWTALMTAAEYNSLECLLWLLENGVDPNCAMSTGWTALHAAAKTGHAEIVKTLLQPGADPSLLARHREFGDNLKPEDVTSDAEILRLLQDC